MLSSSWGLALDLGEAVSEARLQALYDAIWQDARFQGPQFKLGGYRCVPQAAEGALHLEGHEGKTYTKFEEDGIGYPPGWQVPITFTLSVFGFAENLPQSHLLYDFLLAQARLLREIHPYRMAFIGDLGSYYLHAEMVNPAWLDLQQESVLALLLDSAHPLTRQHSGEAFADQLWLYPQAALKSFWTEDDFATRFQRYKEQMAEQLHSQTQPLEWEAPSEN